MKSGGGAHYLKRGDLVEVLSEAEIAETLDADGKLDGVVFMPEMLRYCGQRFRVFRRAEKTCVEGHGMRQMSSTVFLEDLRCDGSQHDGCQRDCLIFWKERWLKPASVGDARGSAPPRAAVPSPLLGAKLRTRDGDRYVCQSTELFAATTDWPRHLLHDFTRELLQGELGIGRFLRILGRALLNNLRSRLAMKPIGVLSGPGSGSKGDLDLRYRDPVRVLPPGAIERTLSANGKNRGLSFDPEMIVHTDKKYSVEFVVKKIISEESGKMVNLTNTVVLKGVRCEGLCAYNCPRSNPIYWRESWLEREPPASPKA